MSLGSNRPLLYAFAFMVVLVSIFIASLYLVDESVGLLPSIVYLISASAISQLSITV